MTVPTALYIWLSTLKITRLKFGSNCNYLSYVLGSSSILTCRISKICFDFFNYTCLKKTIANIRNSTRPNRWATKDITGSWQFLNPNCHYFFYFGYLIIISMTKLYYLDRLEVKLGDSKWLEEIIGIYETNKFNGGVGIQASRLNLLTLKATPLATQSLAILLWIIGVPGCFAYLCSLVKKCTNGTFKVNFL